MSTEPELTLNYPVETNQLFFSLPEPWISRLQEKVDCYIWNEEEREIQFVTSWNTSEEDLERLKKVFADLSE